MQFTTFAYSAMSIAGALAQTVHVVTVASPNGTTKFFPNNVVAAVGDMVQFQFNPKNHTVTQSTFDQPCQPIEQNTNVTGFFSGFMPVTASETVRPAFTVAITSKTPIWVYCSQATHCQAGMSMVINENTAANATRSLANYQAAAKLVLKNEAPSGTFGGSSSSSSGSNTTVTTGSPPTVASGSSSSSSSGSSGSSSGSSSSSSTTAGAAQVTAGSSGAGMVGASSLLSLVAVFMGLVLV